MFSHSKIELLDGVCPKSHIWDFVHLYGIVFDIIVIIIITIMIIKSEGVNAQF